MNVHTYITSLEHGESHVLLSDATLEALRMRPHDVLYAALHKVAPTHRRPTDVRTPEPFASIYASPLPYRAWPRLAQASFTTGPGPGTAHVLLQCLESMDLYARAVATCEQHRFGAASPSTREVAPIVADTSVTFELPLREFRTKGSAYRVRSVNDALHSAIEESLASPDDTNTLRRCLEEFRKRLNTTHKGELALHSVSPLRALNRLGISSSHAVTLTIEENAQATHCGLLSCEQWRRDLWPESRLSAEEARHPEGTPIAVLVSADAPEKLLTLQFFRLDQNLITSFDIVVPSAGLEHRWWRWVYGVIGDAGGSILASRTSARLDGRWGTLSVTCAFPAVRNGVNARSLVDDVAHAVKAFGKLKGSHSPLPRNERAAFTTLSRDIEQREDSDPDSWEPGAVRRRVANHCLGKADAKTQLEKPARVDSTLKNIRLWYRPSSLPVREYEKRFGHNPFSFTRPLDLAEYEKLYPLRQLRTTDSRALLAYRLADRLGGRQSENIVLVGAYRSGKTTVMNMIVDILNGRTRRSTPFAELEAPVLAVRINAAVTPPEQLFTAIYYELRRLANAKEISPVRRSIAQRIVAAGEAAGDMVAGSFEHVFASPSAVEWKFMIPLLAQLKVSFGKAAAAEGATSTSTNYSQTHKERDPAIVAADLAGQLRASVLLLRMLLQQAKHDMEVEGAPRSKSLHDEQLLQLVKSGGFRVVVALDEVTDTTTWGATWAFPAWRQLIEDPGFREARWLFSSTKPLAASTGYSPLGNAMREYNMEPLREEEATALVDAFQSWDPKWWDEDVVDKYRLRPFVSFHAARRIAWLAGNQPYLMQTLLCHLFEESTRREAPIVSSRVVRDVVRSKALPEMADYFYGQWSTFDEAHCAEIVGAVKQLKQRDILRICPDDRTTRFRFTTEAQKSLERAGLGSHRLPLVLVPLFVMWLQEHFALNKE